MVGSESVLPADVIPKEPDAGFARTVDGMAVALSVVEPRFVFSLPSSSGDGIVVVTFGRLDSLLIGVVLSNH